MPAALDQVFKAYDVRGSIPTSWTRSWPSGSGGRSWPSPGPGPWPSVRTCGPRPSPWPMPWPPGRRPRGRRAPGRALLDRHDLLRLRRPRRRRGDADRLPQPGPLQRPQAVPAGRGAGGGGVGPGRHQADGRRRRAGRRRRPPRRRARGRRPAGALRAHVRSFADTGSLRPSRWSPTPATAWPARRPGGLQRPAGSAGADVLRAGRQLPQPPGRPAQPREPQGAPGPGGGRGADVGLAFDGDADRVFLVDERARRRPPAWSGRWWPG